MRRPDRTLATADHNTPTDGTPVAARIKDELSRVQVETLERNCEEFAVPVYSLGSDRQGIVHVIGPELGVTQPGMTIVCGDSHTSTHGAFGALAFGIGTSEVEHVLATQCMVQQKPHSMRIHYKGELGFGVTAKDLILGTLGQLGVGGMTGHAVEYAGPAIEALSMEGRMTVCNMTIEGGGRAGMIAPDETTFAWFRDQERPGAPSGGRARCGDRPLARAAAATTAPSIDQTSSIDASAISPQVTWGTNPGMVRAVTETVPAPEEFDSPADREATERALHYMALGPERRSREIARRPRLHRLVHQLPHRRPARRRRGGGGAGRSRRASARWSCPGSQQVKAQAEAEGLDQVFREAGFDWRVAGCSMCLGMNPDILQPGERCASTSNRNFEGRQGRGGRTHLVSPQMAAAAAIEGQFTDIRRWSSGGWWLWGHTPTVWVVVVDIHRSREVIAMVYTTEGAGAPGAAWQRADVAGAFLDERRALLPLIDVQEDLIRRLLATRERPIARFLDVGAGDGAMSELVLAAQARGPRRCSPTSPSRCSRRGGRTAGSLCGPLADRPLRSIRRPPGQTSCPPVATTPRCRPSRSTTSHPI